VQGVGFRPFVYRLAHLFDLTGWVRNNGGEVEIYAQGPKECLQAFGQALLTRAPPAARARLIEVHSARIESNKEFRILASGMMQTRIHVPADLFTCEECLAELRDPGARRYHYPFINCTQCGPRYTLIRALPYDRSNTTLDSFALCDECAAEYADPNDRRFHAEPLACAACGPALYWHDGRRKTHGNASRWRRRWRHCATGRSSRCAGWVAITFFAMLTNERAVARLRMRKGRPAKPLAVMVPWRGHDGLDYARSWSSCRLSRPRAVRSRATDRPRRRRANAMIAASVAPGLRELALMLPYSPLHHLLLEDFGAALVATSGNLSGEPVLTEPEEVQASSCRRGRRVPAS
jgi:hydrogenase maturation protein HypF